MIYHCPKAIYYALAFSITISVAACQETASKESIGEFVASTGVGNPSSVGKAAYDSSMQTYSITGAGKNMWFGLDEFQFVWKKIKGDFIVQTRAHFPEKGVDQHRKLGWMARTTLETDSPHVNAVVHGDGLTSLQFRRTKGAITEELKSTLTAADVIQLERKGDRYTMSVARFGLPFEITELTGVELGEEIYVGLFVCSHNADVLETAVFKDVRVTIPAPPDLIQYRQYLGSRLEILDMQSGDRRVLYTTKEGIEAPNWTPDGKELIYNSRGKMYRFPLDTKKSLPLDTGFAVKCNNDHLISANGKLLAISHHARELDNKSIIYTLPIGGGTPRQVTDQGPSYLHGWSPDGKTLLYTGERNGEFDIYKIAAEGGKEIRLTTAQGLDDGSEYSPDGEHIYFNSARTGTMQVWRMKADGSGQEQLTHGDLNDWFPHVSPDGKTLVFISFAREIPADKHPFYQHVYLRAMPIESGEPKIIAYLYGGQGTFNVSSWSPDSQAVALVSHTGQ